MIATTRKVYCIGMSICHCQNSKDLINSIKKVQKEFITFYFLSQNKATKVFSSFGKKNSGSRRRNGQIGIGGSGGEGNINFYESCKFFP